MLKLFSLVSGTFLYIAVLFTNLDPGDASPLMLYGLVVFTALCFLFRKLSRDKGLRHKYEVLISVVFLEIIAYLFRLGADETRSLPQGPLPWLHVVILPIAHLVIVAVIVIHSYRQSIQIRDKTI